MLLAGGGLTLAWLAFAHPWFWGGQIIPWDAKAHFYPMIRFVADSWAAGESVLWSPYHYGGFPMIADPQSMILTPSFWPVVLSGAVPSLGFVDAVHLAHLLVAGGAVLAFGRLRGWGWPAALTAAIGAMLAGPVTIRLEHLLMTISYMWLAVALWRLEALLQRGGLWRGLVFGLVLGLMLVDRNHVAYLGAWVLAIYALVRIWPLRGRVVVPMALGGGLALLIAAVPVILLLQLARLSSRQGFDLAEASFQSLHPAALTSFLMPFFFGPLDRWGAFWGPSSIAWGEMLAMHWGMMHGYCGALAVAMLLWGLASGALWRGEPRIWLAMVAGLMIYALGRYTPLFGQLYAILPGVDLFRRPADALIPAGLAVAVLTGALLDRLLRTPRPLTWLGTVLAVLLLCAALGAATGLAVSRDHLEDGLIAMLRLALSLGAVAALILVRRHLTGTARAAVLLGLPAFHAGDLITANSGLILNAQPPSLHRHLVTPAQIPHWAALETELQELDPSGVPWRVETLGLGTAVQNIGQAAGYHNILGYNPIRLGGFDTQIAPEQQNNAGLRRYWGAGMHGYGSELADRLGLRYLLLGAPVAEVDPDLAPEALRLIAVFERDRDRKAYLYENPGAQPRAVLTPAGEVSVTRYAHSEIRLTARCPAPCRLTLHDFAYPGWEATVNGTAQAIETEAGLFRALDLPAGESAVEFRFRPLSWAALSEAVAGLAGGR